MGLADIIWMAVILGGAGYLFYRSFFKKKGGPCGCDSCGCDKK